jgi:WhiB family transcriptional regulator, redox-sensing transcriptional regulator
MVIEELARHIPRWTRRAACIDADDVNFFADGLRSGKPSKPEMAALQVCSGCAVRRPCLEYALTPRRRFGVWDREKKEEMREHDAPEAFGIWGGVRASERKNRTLADLDELLALSDRRAVEP